MAAIASLKLRVVFSRREVIHQLCRRLTEGSADSLPTGMGCQAGTGQFR
jgi:hypothetical protein